MDNIVISGIITVLAIAISCFYLKFEQINNNKNIAEVLPKNIKQAFFGLGMIISSVLIMIMLSLIYDASWLFTIKRIIICTSLWPIAFIDYRQHIIPNKILCFMLIVRFAIAIAEFIFNFKSAKIEMISCLIAAIGILLVLCIMRLIVKDGIGFGDIKLFAVLGLFLGLKGVIPAIFMSFVVSFVVSVFLLLSKRKNRKEQIAFAPSILVGTLLSVIFLGA